MEEETRRPIRASRDVLIPMRDGTRLAATLYLPEEPGKYPGIFSYYPYLKDGWYGIDLEPHYSFFASCGYAVMQVDFRGTGASEGRNPHPFDLQERLDGFDIVEWMAVQPWCTGNVGVWGISYGGITALSIASVNPPHLKAIIPIHATFDNYEWLFRTHGCRGLLLADVDWGTRMAACNLLPPVLWDVDGRWAHLWRDRLTGSSPWFMDWHGAAPSTEFWESRKIPLTDISAPTFVICGWYDAYAAPAFKIFEQVKAQKKVLMGPWKHVLPDLSPRSPIGGARQMVRWWDRWLKEVRNGIDDEPPVTIFVQGREEWRDEMEWPIARAVPQRLYFSAGGTLSASEPSQSEASTYTYDSRVGAGAIGYNGHRLHLAVPTDQSADDHASIMYTGQPFEGDIEITGAPKIRLSVSSNASELTLVAKLCLVDPDGSSRVISRANCNPARTDAHGALEPMQHNERRQISLTMNPTSVVARQGERLRLCLSGSDFPELWPTPIPYKATIYSDPGEGAWIDVPTVPEDPRGLQRPHLESARSDLAPLSQKYCFSQNYDVMRNRLDAKASTFETRMESRYQIEDGTFLLCTHRAEVTTDADNPGTSALVTDTKYELQRAAGGVVVHVRTLITHHTITADAEVYLNGSRFWQKNWRKDSSDWLVQRA